eukprot:1731145-Pleurochrysis_carterae.AAC.2
MLRTLPVRGAGGRVTTVSPTWALCAASSVAQMSGFDPFFIATEHASSNQTVYGSTKTPCRLARESTSAAGVGDGGFGVPAGVGTGRGERAFLALPVLARGGEAGWNGVLLAWSPNSASSRSSNARTSILSRRSSTAMAGLLSATKLGGRVAVIIGDASIMRKAEAAAAKASLPALCSISTRAVLPPEGGSLEMRAARERMPMRKAPIEFAALAS